MTFPTEFDEVCGSYKYVLLNSGYVIFGNACWNVHAAMVVSYREQVNSSRDIVPIAAGTILTLGKHWTFGSSGSTGLKLSGNDDACKEAIIKNLGMEWKYFESSDEEGW